MPKLSALLLAGIALVTGCGGDDDPMDSWVPNDGPPARVTGKAFVFGPNPGSTLEGATVAVAEAPEVATTVAADGTFSFEVPSGGPSTFLLTKSDFHPNQSATLDIGPDGIAMLGFQAPIEDTFQLLGTLADVVPDPTRCQISTTVSRAGTEPYGGDALGAEGAVVTIEPPLPAESGPIYFAYNEGTIFPDRSLTAASIDGGVIFANVPVGEYTLRATLAGTAFTPVHIRCRAGMLVNAAPPNGLQEL